MGMLLEESHPFFVPMYQRAYAWETEVSAFAEDILRLVEAKPNEVSHFFGGLVCIEHTDQTLSRPHSHEIVDGQQRLATIILALARIVQAAEEIGSAAANAGDTAAQQSALTLAEDTRDRFIYWKQAIVAEGRKETLARLNLSTADDPYFQALLKGQVDQPDRESHRLLKEAYNGIHSALIIPTLADATTLLESVSNLERLRTAIVAQSHVILVVSDDRDRAYQLFSVLNDRGRALEDADLLRSHTLAMLQDFESLQKTAASTWDEILSAPANVVRDFLRAYYPSTTAKRVGTPMFKALQEEYFPADVCASESAAADVVKKIAELCEELSVFQMINRGDWPYPPPQGGAAAKTVPAWNRDRLRRLIITLRHDLAIPLLLAAARSVDEARFAELVYMLEIFAFRYKNVCGGHATPPSIAYYKEAVDVRSGGGQHNWTKLRTALRDLIAKSASDAQFRASLESGLTYKRIGGNGNLREFLTVLEEHCSWLANGAHGAPNPDKMMLFDLQNVTLEHIYPQRPKPGESDLDLAPFTQNIGNITFFGPDENAKAGNLRFSDKKNTYYANSRVVMTNGLAKLGDWDLPAYRARVQKLLDDACKVFKI
jgi:hypothetical protein